MLSQLLPNVRIVRSRMCCGFLFSTWILSISLVAQAAKEALTPPQFRLPASASPERYKIHLTLVPDKDTFTGEIEITLNFKQPASVLWLNSEKLTIKDATLTSGGQAIAVRVIPEPKDFAGLSFDHPVSAGPAVLHIKYEGEISRKDMAGIFQVKDGGHWYVYSQFENISARRAFPCFDEPGFKVPWQVTLTVPNSDGAFSNTPMLNQTPGSDGMKTVAFAETKPLPSYLVAMTVGPMEVVDEGHTGAKNTQVRIVVPQGHSAEAQYAANATPQIVNLLEKYFGMPYPYEKLDEVAIPYAGYAMEHPGLVTYGSVIFLMKPDAPLQIKRVATNVIAHELAHQWFGDLVTMAWWDDTWLNEAFASWMANKIVNEYRPEWKMNIDELNNYQSAMNTDELVSSRKVRQEILTNDDIENAFDDITYEKGSGLLNMFESYTGPEKFQHGVQRYLRKYSWKNATSDDFLQEVSGNDASLAKAFSSFLNQAGVPLVRAKLKCNNGSAKLQVSQERFLPFGSQSPSNQLWDIPMCVKYPAGGTEASECALVTRKDQNLALSKARGCPAWVYANAGQAGYYRVLYELQVFASLAENEKGLTLPERVGFVGDISALTQGSLPLGEAMALVPKFTKDPEPDVISKTVDIVGDLDEHIIPDQFKPNYRRYLSDLYKQRSEDLGWKDRPDDSPAVRLLRPVLFELMANHAEDPEFIDQSKKLTLAWINDHKALEPDMLGAVLDSAAAHGDRTLFDRLHEAAKNESDELAQFTILHAIGQFRNPEIEKSDMAFLLGDEFDVHQVLFSILGGGPFTPGARDVAYEFVKQNWDALIAKLPTDSGALLHKVATAYCDEQHRADAEGFFTGRATKYTGGPRNLALTLEKISACVANKNANQASVTEFLEKYSSEKAGGI